MNRTISAPLPAGGRLHTPRRWFGIAILVCGLASCSRLPVSEVAADGDAPTTTYVTTPPTSAPRTSPPTTAEANSSTGPTTTVAPTTVVPTTAAPTTAAPTTAAPTTAAPTTAAPTTAAPTTAAPTTAAPTTVAPTSTTVPATTTTEPVDELEELPYTGPSEAVLFALIGLTMIVFGRTVLDVTGLLARFHRVGENLPPR